jgi:hypothetical protein
MQASLRFQPVGPAEYSLGLFGALDDLFRPPWRRALAQVEEGSLPPPVFFEQALWHSVVAHQWLVDHDDVIVGYWCLFGVNYRDRVGKLGICEVPGHVDYETTLAIVQTVVQRTFDRWDLRKLSCEVAGGDWPRVQNRCGGLFLPEAVLHGHERDADGVAVDLTIAAIMRADVDQA